MRAAVHAGRRGDGHPASRSPTSRLSAKNAGLVTQQVGRVEREHDDKNGSIVLDYADLKIGPLQNQWRERRKEVYVPRGYQIQ